jgi:hypothetical protein
MGNNPGFKQSGISGTEEVKKQQFVQNLYSVKRERFIFLT